MIVLEHFKSDLFLPSPLHEIKWHEDHPPILFKRDDLIHPIISGNKWRKLEGFLESFYRTRKSEINTIGSAFSNHIHSVAYLCFRLNIPCNIIVSGFHGDELNDTLNDCIKWRAQLKFLDRKEATQLKLQDQLHHKDVLWIPEGGAGSEATVGLLKLISELPQNFDHKNNLIVVPCGTGTTMLTILKNTNEIKIAYIKPVRSQYLAIDGSYENRTVDLSEITPITFGAFHQESYELTKKLNEKTGILLDPIYTGPLFFALLKFLDEKSDWDKIYFLHSGGLQSWRGFNKRYGCHAFWDQEYFS